MSDAAWKRRSRNSPAFVAFRRPGCPVAGATSRAFLSTLFPMALRIAVRALLLSVLPTCLLRELQHLGGRVQPLPAANRFSLPDHFVWCGAPVKGPDGKYHLFYSRWPVKAAFAPGWAIHSEIAYAVADRPGGPYRHVNVALPKRGINPATGKKYWDADVTHNSNAFHHAGKYYLYYMGNHGDGKSYPMHRNHQRIGVADRRQARRSLDQTRRTGRHHHRMTRSPSTPSASPTPPPASAPMAAFC